MRSAFHREDIKAGLRKKHGSIAQFERSKGLPQRSVKDVLNGKSRPDIAKAVAAELDRPPHVVFPDRFSPNGDALSRRNPASHLPNGAAK